jgi:pimeloyl-ACP methyl ester carboxylesterase
MTEIASLPAGIVAYDERGTGATTVVLLASGAHDRRDYEELRARLSDEARTIAMDWPGHGDSPAPTGPSGVGAWADVAEQFVEHVAPAGAVVVGNSIGGFAAGRLAARRPELVDGLVLIDAGGFDSSPNRFARAFCALMGRPRFLRTIYPTFSARYMRARTAADRLARERAIATTRRPGTLPHVADLWASFPSPEHDLTAAAAHITAPTLVVWGRHDPVIPLALGRRAAELIAGSELAVLDAGHVPYTTRPDEVADAVLGLLARVDRPGAGGRNAQEARPRGSDARRASSGSRSG